MKNVKRLSLYSIPLRGLAFLAAVVALSTSAAADVGVGDLVISEFRLNGPGGATDQYVELANRTGSDITVAAGGLTIEASSGTVAAVPEGTVIKVGGHWLAAGAGFSLSTLGASFSAVGSGNGVLAAVPFNEGVVLKNEGGVTLDAVGFTTAGASFREGTGLLALTAATPASTQQYAYVRKYVPVTFAVQDTNVNADDFQFVATDGATYDGSPAKLGGPGPQSLATGVEGGFGWGLADTSKAASVSPNRVRNGSGNSGSLEFRRRLTNNTGATVSALRVRVVDVTTFTGGASPGGTTADLRAITSTDSAITTVAPAAGTFALEGVTLEESPMTYKQTAAVASGGANSSWFVTLPASLSAGESVYVNLKFAVAKNGAFSVRMINEFLP